MINNLQITLLFFINKQIGANKQLYLPFRIIYDAAQDKYTQKDIPAALKGLTNSGYLENRDQSYRITVSGFIFIEAYVISNEIKEALEKELRTRLGYQWIVIVIAFLAILFVVLRK